jgi:Flp pilus assembly protein TadB
MGWTLVIPMVGLLLAAAALQLWRNREFRQLRERFERDGDLRQELKSLPFKDRRRITRAARRGESIEDPREARLAADSAQRQLAVLEIIHRAPRLRFGVGLGFLVLGAVSGMLLVAGLGVLVLAIELHSTVRTRRLRGRLKEAAQVNR